MEEKIIAENVTTEEKVMAGNFIHDEIDADNESHRYDNEVITRFPPEPNGYLHIGHAKSICLNFGTAGKYKGQCNMRFDDTNPSKEEEEFVESILEDVKWLGFDWGKNLYYTSDYFHEIYEAAVELILNGKAYICELNADEMRAHRGSVGVAATSPYRERPIEESLDIFQRMKAGEFEEGRYTLRAKIDLESPNFWMRDPVIYRIQKSNHNRTGDEWCIYPMYDFAHPISDSLENITHSICTLEFEIHRPLYAWVLENITCPTQSRQIEFARLNLTHTVMSKRFLRKLVEEGFVNGWDDPRMPTISGLRRRGYTPASIRDFCERIGVAKADSTVDTALLEHCLREELNQTADRVMCVLDPLKVVITNFPEDLTEQLEIENNPQDETRGTRTLPFSREIYIEREDFKEEAPRKYNRLKPEGDVRLKAAYIITCTDVIKDENGEILEVHCTYDPETLSGRANAGKKVKGTIHWIDAKENVNAEVRLYNHLFDAEDPYDVPEGTDFTDNLSDHSLTVLPNAKMEKITVDIQDKFQFLRHGYFTVDKDTSSEKMVFNRITSLKGSYKA